MTTKRVRRAHTMRQNLTAEAVAAFRVGDWMALHHALRLPPWHVSPLDAIGKCPVKSPGSGWSDTWDAALQLRSLLLTSH